MILDMAGGMMHTATLNFLTWLVTMVLFVVLGTVCLYIMGLLTAQSEREASAPIVIKDAQ